ncbi:RmlC-like cupin domain-containing protein [Aspergillus californicus]
MISARFISFLSPSLAILVPQTAAQPPGKSIVIPNSRIGENSTSPSSATFTGDAWVDDVYRDSDGTITTVMFGPGARTFWHSHAEGQVLRVLAGAGWVTDEGDRPRRINVGDTVWCQANTTHWHGADQGSYLVHLAISQGTTEWLGPVTEEEYHEALE